MTVEVSCPACSGAFKVAEQHIGKRAKCPKCGARFLIVAPQDEDEPVLADLDWQSPIPIPVSLPSPPPLAKPEALPPQKFPPPQFAAAIPTPSDRTNAISPIAAGCGGAMLLGLIGFCGFAGLFSMMTGNSNGSKSGGGAVSAPSFVAPSSKPSTEQSIQRNSSKWYEGGTHGNRI